MAIRLPPSRARASARAASGFSITVGERSISVAVRRNLRAHRYILRLCVRDDGAVVTIPRRGTLAEAKAFVNRQSGWLADRLARRPQAPPAAVPQTITLRGRPHAVVATGAARGLVRCEAGSDGSGRLLVPGEAAHVRRRLSDHLKKEARADLAAAVDRHAAALGVRPTAIRIRDTTSRWGSASARGVLSFSWRLVMAPAFVLDYVAAHEVAHLVEMNHSDRFWTICRRLAPRGEEAQLWLKEHGAGLHRLP